MEQEQHHHLVFENSYVRAYYVEIPGHESTLYHRHDLPYVSLPPPSSSALPTAPRVGYTPGGFSHAVNNPSNAPLQNVAVELLRPQGNARNRCMEAIRGQPLNDCDKPASPSPSLPLHYALFETGEILVEYWELSPNSATNPADTRLDMLVGSLSGITAVDAATASPLEAQAGLTWLPAGSDTIFKTGAKSGGHYITIKFKDSASAQASQ
jgi:hypothetical protein